MRLINPVTVNDSNLTSSTIPEPDAALGEVLWTAGSYVVGDERIKTTTHRRYRCAINTTDDPEVGVLKSPQTWVDIGATNKFAMFDNQNGSKSTATGSIIVEFTPNEFISAIAGFYISGASSIQITMTDPVDGVVYDNTLDMLDSEDIVDYYEWFFYPIITISEFVLTDLPAYIDAVLRVEITGSATVEIGSIPFGATSELGVANYGSSFSLVDLSKKEQDEFGNYTIRERPAIDAVEFDITVPRARTRYVRNLVAKYRTSPVVWIGGEGGDNPVFTFGYYKNLRVNIDAPQVCSASLQIEELV